jgi:hypothetical protein
MMSDIKVGTSGFQFNDRRGTIHPKGLPDKDMLPTYIPSKDEKYDCTSSSISFGCPDYGAAHCPSCSVKRKPDKHSRSQRK